MRRWSSAHRPDPLPFPALQARGIRPHQSPLRVLHWDHRLPCLPPATIGCAWSVAREEHVNGKFFAKVGGGRKRLANSGLQQTLAAETWYVRRTGGCEAALVGFALSVLRCCLSPSSTEGTLWLWLARCLFLRRASTN